MKLHIPRDVFDNPTPPRLILCQTNREKIGELPAYDIQLNAKWNAYSELSFTINRMYNDILTGETKVHPLFDLAEGLRKVYVEGFGYFTIQDPDTEYSDNETKKLSCFSIEYETGQKYLDNFFINTGEDESVEVTYWASKFGNNYFNEDIKYTKVNISTDIYDEYKKYYIKSYDSAEKYTYELVSIADKTVYDTYDGSTVSKTLYVQAWPNVQFYNDTNKELSLLHLVFKKIPEWHIGYVDSNLWKQERKFDEERVAVYDFLMNDVCDTFKCVIEWDTINMEVNFYEEEEDGITKDGEIQTRFDTDVFISRDNLANSINIKYSTDDIKTKLKVTGGDDLDIREVNLGQNYILNLDYYHTVEWMGQELYDKYTSYKSVLESNQEIYENLMQEWVKSFNVWNDLMNAVPEDNSIMLVGDEFKKLYCTYAPVTKEGATEDEINTAINTAVESLKGRLQIHGVDEDTEGIASDNVLLTLRKGEDSATIRVYYDGTNKVFKVKRLLTSASNGATTSMYFTLKEWVKGISADSMNLGGFTVHYIGTLGAYLCLARDERYEENLQDYGIKLLKEKQDVYKTIFITQTEGYMSKETAMCLAQDDEPTGEITVGAKWLDTNSDPLTLYEYNGVAWNKADVSDMKDQKDYARYIENYDKLKSVQSVLLKKEKQAAHYLNGYTISNENIDGYISNPNFSDEDIKAIFKDIVIGHFDSIYGEGKYVITDLTFDRTSSIYTLQISLSENDMTSYVFCSKNGFPYIEYEKSQGILKKKMSEIKSTVDMENYFDDEEWMRLSPFIKEDEFNDSNFALNGYESEENRLSICRDLKSAAEKELKTLSQPSLEFSMDMANILAIPEFDPIKDHFALGNFITVGIRPDYVKKSRLLEVSLDFDDISSLKATFGNLITTKSEIDKHAELLKQAVTAGKSVAANANSWQKAVDKSNSIDKAIREGLKDAALEVGAAHGQSITWDQYGIWGRKLMDGTTDQYEDEQFRIINNKIVFSADNWNTSQSVFGKFQYDADKDGVKETHWGVLAQSLIGGYIEGSEIVGGSLKIGGNDGDKGTFIVNEDGSVEIRSGTGDNSYDVIEKIENSRQYHIQLLCDGSTILTKKNQSTTITCKVYKWDEDITSTLPIGTKFNWIRSSNTDDTDWNNTHIITKSDTNASTCNQITITNSDVTKNAQFSCQVEFTE